MDNPTPQHNEHPLDGYLPSPNGSRPTCGRAQFDDIVRGMVADDAPRLFAVVQEYGERIDVRIAAWGMAFDDHAEVVGVERDMRMSLQAPENALRGFAWGSHVNARLVWVDPAAATPCDDPAPAD